MQRVVFVTGTPCAGTSAIASALSYCGFSRAPTRNAEPPGSPADTDKPSSIGLLNKRLLEMAGARWDRVPLTLDFDTLRPKGFGDWCADLGAEAAERAWDATFGNAEGDLVCEAPQLSLTLPLWQSIAAKKGYSAETLIVYRNPLDVMSTLKRKHGIDFAAAVELITDYWLAILPSVGKTPVHVVSFDRFQEDPGGTLRTLGLELQSDLPAEHLSPRSSRSDPGPRAARTLLPAPLRALDAMLRDSHGTPPQTDMADLKRFLRDRENRKRFSESVNLVAQSPTPNPPLGPQAPRTVVLHCHIFKNAGSSVDVLLKRYFGDRWQMHEFRRRRSVSNADLTNAFIRHDDTIAALSTHTGDWWLGHDGDGVTVLPIMFLRHPLLRIRSAYSFERKQDADTLGTKLARSYDFPGYVKARLDRENDYAFHNFQAHRLAAFESRVITDLRTSALDAFARAPFLGLVDAFDASIERLQGFLAPHFADFTVQSTRVNVSDSSSATPEEKLSRIHDEFGADLYDELCVANAIDLELYDRLTANYASAADLERDKLSETGT